MHKLKVIYILPEIAEHTATHFAHKRDLMQEFQNDIEFFVYAPTLIGIAKIKIAYFFRSARIFYVHYSFKGALLALLLTKLFGGRVFYWNCGMPWVYRRGWLEERIFRFILKRTVFVTGTNGLAELYAEQYSLDRAHIRVVSNYIRVSRMREIRRDEGRKKLGITPEKKVVLFLHRLSRRKGAHLLPGIIKEFTDQDDVLFLVVGDGPEREKIESRIMNYELWGNVRMEGSVSNSKTPVYFAVADVFLMPSEEEGMPNVLLEAMAVGIPFAVSDVGGVKEMTPPDLHEYVLPYGDVAMFVEKIKKLLESKELRERISKEEQEWVTQYDVATVAPKFLELLEKEKK